MLRETVTCYCTVIILPVEASTCCHSVTIESGDHGFGEAFRRVPETLPQRGHSPDRSLIIPGLPTSPKPLALIPKFYGPIVPYDYPTFCPAFVKPNPEPSFLADLGSPEPEGRS